MAEELTFDDFDDDDDGRVESRFVLPLGPKPFVWSQPQSVAVVAATACRLVRLLVPPDIGRFYRVEQISVGDDELLVAETWGEMFGMTGLPVELNVSLPAGGLIRVRVRPEKPRPAQSFTIAWWVRWFTREGWRGRTRRRPPEFTAALVVATVV